MDELLTVSGLNVRAMTSEGAIPLLKDINLSLHKGEVLGMIGESGSGKTTAVRSIIGLLDRNVSVDSGEIKFRGTLLKSPKVENYRAVRGKHIGMVFQGVGQSLDPMMRVGAQIEEVARRHGPGLSRGDARALALETIGAMGFPNPIVMAKSYPHELSGGMRQRVSIALAMVTHPELLIADECTSALDVTTQRSVIQLLASLVDSNDMGMLFVTHDLMLAEEICTSIAVLQSGRVVEYGKTEQVLGSPREEYTQALLRAIPSW